MDDLERCNEIKRELQTVSDTHDIVPQDRPYDRILELAISQGAPLEQLEKWMELKQRYEADEARKAYHEAMAAFKSNPPKIFKDRKVGYKGKNDSSVGYSHASLGNVAEKISSELSKNGLSALWKTDQAEGKVTVTCTITHRLGHSESTTLSAAPDNSGSKNSIQAIGSTISYLERYTILAITGLATYDMDDDGKESEPVEYITTDQQTEVNDLVKEIYDPKPELFWKFMQVDCAEQIQAKDYKKAISTLAKAKEAKSKRAKS